MGIVVKINAKKDYEKVSEGMHQAVLADIVELGVEQTKFGPKDRVRLVWITDEADKEGRSKLVFEKFTLSLHEKAGLAKRFKSIGIAVPTANDAEFDLDKALGTNARLVIQHSEPTPDGDVYANVASALKADPKATRLSIPKDFVRQQDKPAKN
jgi:hypothetical protein